LIPETKPSSSARISASLRFLGHTLDSFWLWIVSLFSKARTPSTQAPPPKTKATDTRHSSQSVSQRSIRVVIESLPPTPSPSEEQKSEKKRENRFKWGKAILEILAFLTLVAYTYETKRTNDLTQRALDTSKEQFREQQRPYVWLISGNDNVTVKTNGYGKPVTLTMKYQNYGPSPAIITRTTADAEIRTTKGFAAGKLHRRDGGSGWNDIKSVLPPGKFDYVNVDTTEVLTKDNEPLVNGDFGLAALTILQFTDMHSHRYETEVCFIRFQTGFTYCPQFNRMRDCEKETCAN
jgi:hypothetical protein